MTDSAPTLDRYPTTRDAGPFDPPSVLTGLRERRPVSPLTFPDGHQGWLVTGYREARQVLADTRFSSRQDVVLVHDPFGLPGLPALTEPPPKAPGMFISMDPPEHTRLRRKLTGAFTVRRMRELEERVAEIVERQLDHLAGLPQPVDLVAEFAFPVPSLVICEMLGVPYADRDSFQATSQRILDLSLPFEEKAAGNVELGEYLAELVAAKRAEPGADLLSDLAADPDLSLEELTGIAFLLLFAGHETTANMVALGTFALLEHPEQWDALRTEPELVPGAAEELLRHLAVVDVTSRYATEDLEVGGERIAAGSTVVVSLLSANRDPRRFAEPDLLDVRGQGRGHLAFGHGVHQCLGQQLARVELRVGIEGLVRRFPGLRLAVPAEQVRLRTNMLIYGVHELPVRWD